MSPGAPDRPFTKPAEVAELVAAFERCTLPKAQWTHRAHLTVALWYLTRRSADEALDAMRRGILRYNEACGVATTATGGYHETITRLYLRLVARFARTDAPGGDWAERANRLYDHLGARDLPYRHYTRDRLMSPAARSGWVEPDLLPLP